MIRVWRANGRRAPRGDRQTELVAMSPLHGISTPLNRILWHIARSGGGRGLAVGKIALPFSSSAKLCRPCWHSVSRFDISEAFATPKRGSAVRLGLCCPHCPNFNSAAALHPQVTPTLSSREGWPRMGSESLPPPYWSFSLTA